MTDRKLFRRWLRKLKAIAPSCFPVRVRLVPPGGKGMPIDRDGETHVYADGLTVKRFDVLIRDGRPWDSTQDTLLHEWAHVLRYHAWGLKYDGTPDSDPVFGILFNELKARFHE